MKPPKGLNFFMVLNGIPQPNIIFSTFAATKLPPTVSEYAPISTLWHAATPMRITVV